MGSDKSMAMVGGRYILETIHERLSQVFPKVKLCANSKEKFARFGLEVISDIYMEKGPAAAIHSALSQTTARYVFAVACDMPFVDMRHIEYMASALESSFAPPHALVPLNGRHIEPLYAFYSAKAATIFDAQLSSGNHKIYNILRHCDVLYLQEQHSRMFDQDLRMFVNLNYAQDFEVAYGNKCNNP
jgi:molybdopterin-guanine dinucleotide biosynthesis protein A